LAVPLAHTPVEHTQHLLDPSESFHLCLVKFAKKKEFYTLLASMITLNCVLITCSAAYVIVEELVLLQQQLLDMTSSISRGRMELDSDVVR